MRSPTEPIPSRPLRVVSWNCNMALNRVGRGRTKAERLLALEPDIAVVQECSDSAVLDGMNRIVWTGAYPTKGLAVFARPELAGREYLDADATRQWFAPVQFPGLGLNLLGCWAMHHRGQEPRPARGRIHATMEHYADFLAGGRSIVIGDLNDHTRWDTTRYPSFARLTTQLDAQGLTNLYYARTGEIPNEETRPSLYWYRHRDKPYLVDWAFIPSDWIARVSSFDIGEYDAWHEASDHMPLIIDLDLPLPDAPELPQYSPRLMDALSVAARLHVAQVRKATDVPYLAHLLGTCAVALEYGATEDEAIAALLHDAIEDVQPVALARRAVAGFGPEVLRIVEACTDADSHPKPPWRNRKEAYIRKLAAADRSVLLVSASDKLHNARAIVADLRRIGAAVWDRFNRDADSIWYYRSLVTAYQANPEHAEDLVAELDWTVTEIERLASAAS